MIEKINSMTEEKIYDNWIEFEEITNPINLNNKEN